MQDSFLEGGIACFHISKFQKLLVSADEIIQVISPIRRHVQEA